MSQSLSEQKAALRSAARATLGTLSAEQKEAASRIVRERLIALPPWQQARSVLLFAPRPDEPDVRPLVELALRERKQVALPRFVAGSTSYESALISDPVADLVPGRFNIPEPAPVCKVADLKQLDLVLVPGLAFDWHGHRLGRGKGFYDRLLATVSGRTCGVAFDSQLISALPVEPHDVRLNCILTPTHWLEF